MIKISKSLTYEYAKNFIEVDSSSGCTLLSKECISSTQPLLLLDKNGHEFYVSFNKFKSGNQRQCKNCSYQESRTRQAKSYDYIKRYIEVESNSGCELLSQEYINVLSTLVIKCKCGEIFETTFDRFVYKNKRQCNNCGLDFKRKLFRKPFEELKYFIEINSNCVLITTEDQYTNSNDVIILKCACGTTFYTRFWDFKNNNKRQCNECSKDLKIQHNIIKFGVSNPMQSIVVYSKAKQTLYQNDTAPCSIQQRYLYDLYGGELNYPDKSLSLDIAFPDDNIFIEYDGGGHRHSVKIGSISEEEFNKKERNRSYALCRSGWKEIRIISIKDHLPSDDILLKMLSYAKEYLSTGHHYIKFDIDNSKVINSQGEFDYDYGKLRQIRKLKQVV